MQLIKIFNFVLMATNRTTFFSLKCLQTQGDIIKTNTKHNLSYKTNQIEKKKTKNKKQNKTQNADLTIQVESKQIQNTIFHIKLINFKKKKQKQKQKTKTKHKTPI